MCERGGKGCVRGMGREGWEGMCERGGKGCVRGVGRGV